MTPERKNMDSRPPFPDNLPNPRIEWDKSKEQIWAEMESRLDLAPETPVRTLRPRMILSMAATLAVLIGLTLFMTLFTRTITVNPGNREMSTLPDGSTVRLNAESQISYKPLLWMVSRKVRLTGEAYFEGEHGRHFEVVSETGKTTVVGTSFNIYARGTTYAVTCITGKVSVMGAASREEVMLSGGQTAEIAGSGRPQLVETANAAQVMSWMDHRISLTSVPIRRVFEEIARQYGVAIAIPESLDYIYTGNFDCSMPVESALQTVCKPFNLNFVQNADNAYTISKGP